MTKKNYFRESVSTTIGKKVVAFVSAFVLVCSLNAAMAQCPTPTITPSGSVDLCSGGSVTLTATAGSSYLWSTGAITQAITVSAAGAYVVTVDDGAGCIEASDPTNVTLNSLIPGGINNFLGATSACPGDSKVYSVNPTLRVVYYVWTAPAGATINGQASLQTASTSVTVDFGPGFTGGALQVAAHNGCGVRGPVSKNINTQPAGTPASITGPTETCANTSYTFSTPVVAGVTSYNWIGPAGSVITGNGSASVDILFPAGYISGYVRVSNENACGASPLRSIYTRSTAPKPGDISGPVSGLCNTTQTYTIAPVLGATSYTWTPPAGSTVVAGQGTTSADINFNSNLNNGYVTVVANNACGASPESKLRLDGEVFVSDHPDSAALCTGQVHTLSVFSPGGGLSYQWRKDGIDLVDGGHLSGATTADLFIDSIALSDAGVYDVIVSSTCSDPDTSLPALITVTAKPDLPAAIVGDTVACDGLTGIPYSISPVAGADTYQWSGNTGVTFASGQGTNAVTVDFGPTPNSGYAISVRGVNTCGGGPAVALWARKNISTPVFTTSTGVACPGTNGVAFSVNPVTGASSYTWIAPANATVASGQGTATATFDFGAGFTSGQVCVTASNLCMTTPQRCVNVISTPNIPGAINGTSTNLCNASQAFTVNNVAGATQYNWTAPSGATVSAGQGTNNATLDFGPAFTTGNVTVTAENACGISPARARSLTAFPARPLVVNGDAAPCANSTGNVYSVDPLTGATSYVWTVPTGSTITAGSGTNSITVTFGANAGSVTARGVNACGAGSAKALVIAFSCRIQNGGSSSIAATVYPNPATDRLNIVHDNSISGAVSIRITDLAGRTLVNQEETIADASQESVVNIADLTPGVYVIEITSVMGTSVNRFIKD